MSATPSSYYTAFIRGDSCLPQTGPVSKSFSAVRGTDRISSRVLWSLLFSSWNNPHARVAHLGVSCPEPHCDLGLFPPEASPCHEQTIELCVFLHLPIFFFLFPGFPLKFWGQIWLLRSTKEARSKDLSSLSRKPACTRCVRQNGAPHRCTHFIAAAGDLYR